MLLLLCYITSSTLKPSITFSVSCDHVTYDYNITLCFFFLGQQFITWDTVIDYGSYSITTYI